jgi:hypothetical protein
MIGVLTESLEGVICLTNVVFAALQFKDVDVDHWASIGCNVICRSHSNRKGSVCIDPLNPLCIEKRLKLYSLSNE